MESRMYINDRETTTVATRTKDVKCASTSSIPVALMKEEEEEQERKIESNLEDDKNDSDVNKSDTSTVGSITSVNKNNNNNNSPAMINATIPLVGKGRRRYSVLEDLKARRDSLLQKASAVRRGSVVIVTDQNIKEPNEKDERFIRDVATTGKEKRRSSEGGRRASVFYVSDDLLEENQETLEKEEDRRARAEFEGKKGRRKSWHPLIKPPKLDRKRRKGIADPPSGQPETEMPYHRQKRPSWWNIFVPDSVGRSRRMSQDVTYSKSTESLTAPYFRNKSRSVDHGFTAPFDLDALRNKVEGRFESVDKLSRDSENESKDGSITQEKKVGGRVSQPINTIAYTVGERDTLTSVAARFDTTPSELSKLNRLGSTFIYPGQQLWVPAKGEGRPGAAGVSIDAPPSPDPCQDHESQDDLPPEEKELLDNLRPVSPKPGHTERVRTPLGGTNTVMEENERPFGERFLKINVRHITDGQGVVGGVLLVTPNAIMFDPNVSDPLVIEHGAESYGVIAPMEFVVNAAIYYDIAHMRVGHTESGNLDKKPEIYYAKKPSRTDNNCKCQSPGKDENFPELTTDDSESVCSCAERDGDAFPKAFERDLVTPTNLQNDENATASTKDQDKDSSSSSSAAKEIYTGQGSRTLEERRRSRLDHHWAVPSKDRCTLSMDDEQQDSLSSCEKEKTEAGGTTSTSSKVNAEEEEGSLVKQSCHDSGIDIRDPNPPLPVVQPIPSKKVYSDADIVLSSDWVPPITIAPTNITTSSLDTGTTINGRKKASSVSFSLDNSNSEEQEKDEEHKDEDKQETRRNKMLKRLSYPLSWMEGLTGEKEDESKSSGSDKVPSLPNSADSHHSSVFSKVFSRRSSVGTFIRQQPLTSSGSSSIDSSRGSKASAPAPRLDYRSMVSVEDMPELFVSFDKLIPRPARSCEDPPLYLRLRTGRLKDKKIPKSTPIMSYGKKKLRPEYWFSIPRNRVDDLYRFINAWVPQLYGELNENYWIERGYILSDTDTDLSPELSPHEAGEYGEAGEEGRSRNQDGDEITELTKESWEVLSMSEELRRALYANSAISLDNDVIVPDLVGTTEILSDEHRECLCRHLPARAEGYLWTLVFSTSQHGFSLNSMYRKMAKIESPILLVIQDTEGNVFGALTSCALHVSDHFYGTGESLLFRFTPKFQAFNWTGDNLYFIKGNNESLAIGAGDGKFGLWLDGDLYQGRTQSCSTYGNEPLAPHEDFVVKTLECWAFI